MCKVYGECQVIPINTDLNFFSLSCRYQAFVSGCDDGAAVSGISHKVFDVDPANVAHVSANATGFLSTAVSYIQSAVRLLGGRQIGTLAVVLLQFFGSLAARLLLRLPLIGAIGGAFVGFRKIIRPWSVHLIVTLQAFLRYSASLTWMVFRFGHG